MHEVVAVAHDQDAGGGGRFRGRRSNYTSAASSTKKGLCVVALGNNVFDYRQKGSAEQMRTTWEKIVQYVGTTYRQDISNELQNKTRVTLAEPAQSVKP